jgi:hypothetical protein
MSGKRGRLTNAAAALAILLGSIALAERYPQQAHAIEETRTYMLAALAIAAYEANPRKENR